MLPALYLWTLLAANGECPSALERGRRAYEARRFEDAAVQFDRALQVCSEPNRVLLPLAQAQLMAQNLKASLGSVHDFLKVEPNNVNALKLKGDLLYLLGREAEAEQSLQSALQIRPDHEASLYALGRIYYQQNRIPDAQKLFRNIIDRDAKNYRAHDNLALCYAALQKDSDAVRHFLKALDLVNKDHTEYDVVYANFANFLLDRGHYEKAFQLAAEAAQRNPGSARNFFLTGKALVKLDKPELSVRWFTEAVQLDPAYPEPRYWLAQVYRKLGKAEEANRELDRFRELSQAPRQRR
jgi:tetratricopeptide (TPR) repeat protein